MEIKLIRRAAVVIGGLILFGSEPACAQQETLRQKIAAIISETNGSVGVAMTAFGTMDTLTVSASKRFPMQSVYKFPLGMFVMDQIDKGKFTLDQKLHITKKELLPDTHSPMRDKYPEGSDIPLSEVLRFTVSESDNNGCDILFRLTGGPDKLNAYIHTIGVAGINITATEEEMHRDWKIQYDNNATPAAMLQLLAVFFEGKHLSKTSNDFLWKLMTEGSTGPGKIKGMLPAGTLVAHKTGYSGTNNKGLIGATNDVGIISLPNGKYFAIAVFITDATDPVEKCEAVIAKISKVAWDHYVFVR